MKRVLAIILGGGAGTRLYPLTRLRAKPAVPLGAKYRLIDIPISNCINSEIHRIYVLTQFNSASLNRHIARTYALASVGFSQGFVEVLAAQQTPDSPSWFEGTADAVRKNLIHQLVPLPPAMRRRRRALCSRDITVPIGIERTSAISRYESPSRSLSMMMAR